MSTTADSGSPRAVRRFWWRAHQGWRLTIASLGVLTALTVTAVAGFSGAARSDEHGGAGRESAVRRGDSIEVTVRAVSEVDLFEGVELATGLYFRAHVAGLRTIDGCRVAESRAIAEEYLLGVKVRLVVRKDGSSDSDRIVVDVRLPDGSDYARTMVDDGVAPADLTVREDLASVESGARQGHRGLWAADCVSSVATSSAAAGTTATTTTTTAAEDVVTSTPTATTEVPAPVTSTTPPPPADEWVEARVGKPCLIEGMRMTSPSGNDVVCARNRKNQLRWRRAE